jgi:hypothetical protein
MKFRPSPVMLSLALALLYSAALSILVEAPSGPATLPLSDSAQALESGSAIPATLARTPGAALRVRMTLPYVPQNTPRDRVQQEI